MSFLPRKGLLAIAAVVDVALHGRERPVAARELAARHDLPARHLEPVLQALVHAGIFNSVRGPRGGYELARERKRISVAEFCAQPTPSTTTMMTPPPRASSNRPCFPRSRTRSGPLLRR